MGEKDKLKRATYNMWTFIVSKLISSLGSSIYTFGISFYIISATGSATNFAMNLVCSILPRTLFAPIAGYVADTFNKKIIIVFAQILSALSVSGLLIYSLIDGISLTAIYITTALLSLVSAFSGVTFTSAIANLVDPERIQKAVSFNQTSLSLATIGGPAIGGLLYGLVSLPVFLTIFIIAFVIATILEATMDFKLYTKKKENAKKEKMLQSIKEGIHYLKTNELISRIVIIALIINFFFGAFQVGFSFVLIDVLKMEATHFGIVEASFSLGMLLASIYIGIRSTFKSPLFIAKWGIVIMSIGMGCISIPLFIHFDYWGNFIYYIILLFVFGAVEIIANVPIGVLMQTSLDEEYRGRVFSIMETMAMGLMPLAMIVFGILYDFIAAQYILIVSASVLIVIIFILIPAHLVRKFSQETKQLSEEKAAIND